MATSASAAQIDGLEVSRQAAKALSSGKLVEAIELYSRALDDKELANDRRGVILTDRAVVYARLDKPDLAMADFNRAVTLFPEYAAAYNNRGAFLVSLGALDEGIKDFDRALVLAPGYVAAWNNRGAANAKAGRQAVALADYTRAIKLAPGLAEPLAGRAQVHLDQSRPHTALRDLTRAVGNDSRFALGFRARADAHMRLQFYAEAAEDLSRAIAFNPVDPQAYLLRARAYLHAKDFDAALKDFTKVIELDPRSAEAYRERGNVNVLQDDFEQAEQDLARAIELDPRNPVAFAYRALMYKKRDQAQLGIQEIEKALNIDNENAIAVWAKGELDEARSMLVEAADSYRRALALDPELNMARLGLRRLGQDIPDRTMRLTQNAVESWQIELQNGRYHAVSDDYSDLRVPLEMIGTGQPRLTSWEIKDAPFNGIGLLRFSVGKVTHGGASGDAEMIALIDIRNSRLLAIEPHRLGDEESTWSWQDGAVTVAAIDGLTSVHQLRRVAPPAAVATAPVVRERSTRRRPDGNQTPAWAPWADHTTPVSRARTTTAQPRNPPRRRPKTLFDMILGN
jgi:tetratricopeptide (TPR) repeat protein